MKQTIHTANPEQRARYIKPHLRPQGKWSHLTTQVVSPPGGFGPIKFPK